MMSKISVKTVSFLERHLITRVFLHSIRNFFNDNCVTFAAAVSFYFLLSFIPFVILLGSLTGYFLETFRIFHDLTMDEMSLQIKEYIEFVIPYITEDYVSRFLKLSSYSLELGIIGILTLFITATLLFSSLQRSFFNIFGGKKIGVIISRLMGVVFLITLIVLMFFLNYLLMFIGSLSSFIDSSIPFLSDFIEIIESRSGVLSFVFTTLLIILLFQILLFYFTSNIKRYISAVFLGGTLFSVLWSVVKWGFDIYLSKLSGINVVYGSATWIVTAVIWVYYTAILFFFSMEFIKVLFELFESKKSESKH